MSYPQPKGKRRIMRSFKLREISAVDIPAQEPALAALIKSAAPVGQLIAKTWGAVEEPALMTTSSDGHTHLVTAADAMSGETGYGKADGEEYGHSHPWIRDAQTGLIVIGEQLGHTHIIEGAGKRAPQPSQPAIEHKESVMDPKDKEIATLKLETTRLTEELAKALKLGELTDAEKAYAKTLDGPHRDLFVTKTAPERESIVKAYTEVVYTDADGNKYTKADDPRMIANAKRADLAAKRAEDAEAKERAGAMSKRASDELANYPGTAEDKAWMLGALDKAATAEAAVENAPEVAKERGKRIGEILKAGDTALSGAFVAADEVIDGGDEGEEGGQPTLKAAPRKASETVGIAKNADGAKFDRLVREHMAKHKVSEPKATVAVMNTPEGSALYKSAYEPSAEAAALAAGIDN